MRMKVVNRDRCSMQHNNNFVSYKLNLGEKPLKEQFTKNLISVIVSSHILFHCEAPDGRRHVAWLTES